MKEFIDYILRFGTLNQQQIDLLTKTSAEIELRKDEYFAEAGKIFKQVGFVVEGVLRICYYSNTGEEITKYFFDEGHLLLNPYNNNEPFTAYVQAATDCKLIVFSHQDWQEISNTIIDWDRIVDKIISKYHLEKLERRSPLVSEDATTRYLRFIENFPTIANRVPLSYIASYLGITQSSLSRIRKSIR